MRGKTIFLTGMLLLGSSVLPHGGISYAAEASNHDYNEINSSYYLIHYNGDETEIIVNENSKVVLSGWSDESKTSVNSKLILTDLSDGSTDLKLDVSNELNEIKIDENEKIKLRIVQSEFFKVEEVTSPELKEQSAVLTENENGTTIEEVEMVDNHGTMIEKDALKYYSIENQQKVEISKEQYDTINSKTVVPPMADEISKDRVEDNTDTTVQCWMNLMKIALLLSKTSRRSHKHLVYLVRQWRLQSLLLNIEHMSKIMVGNKTLPLTGKCQVLQERQNDWRVLKFQSIVI